MTASPTLFGYRVDSELPVSRLRTGRGGRGTLTIRRSADTIERDERSEVARIDDHEGNPLFCVAREGDLLRLWCSLTGGYRLDPGRGLIETDVGEVGGWWQDRITNAIVPTLLGARGELVLHAAALAGPRGAVLICATTGRGKSTLADALGRLHAPVLAEDGVALSREDDRLVAWPGPAGVRLREAGAAHGAPKAVRGHASAAGADPVPVAAIALLRARGGSRVESRSLTLEEALPPLFSHAIGPPDEHRQARFSLLTALLGQARAHELRMPDDLGALDANATEAWERLIGPH